MASTQTLSSPVGQAYREITACRMTGSERLVSILDLGTMAMTGVFPRPGVEVPSGPVELVLCPDGGLVQLRQSYDPSLMYGENYGYRSGLNRSMVRHLGEITQTLEALRPTVAGDVILDIGSNDGTLLGAYPNRGQLFIGMDPTLGKFWRFYAPHIRQKIPECFSEANYWNVTDDKAKIITSIAMLYDLEDPVEFMRAVARILAPDGLWYTEQSYLPALLDSCAYDTVCHEHLEYYGLTQLYLMAERAGLRILDARQNDTNGGSLAVIFAHMDADYAPNSAPIRHLMHEESARALHSPLGFVKFRAAVQRHRRMLPALIRGLRAGGKTVFGYGASTKGNVLLQACGLTAEDLSCIADVNPDKHGCVTPGTHIPIVSEAEAHALQPDYFLVLPWHFKANILEREAAFLQRGGQLIFPLPSIHIAGA